MKNIRIFEKVLLMIFLVFATSCDEIEDVLDGGSGVNIESGLMAYYTFDNSTADDITENELNGVLNNNPVFISETVSGQGKAVFFNAQKGQYMNIPYSPFSELTSYSFSMWVKDFGYGSFLNVEKRFDFYYDEDGGFHMDRNVSNYVDRFVFTYNASPLIDGSWHMISVVSNIDNQQLYVDGNLVASEDAIIRTTSGSSFKMLVDNHMKFDNLRLYNRAISAKEVKAIYNKEK